ncbi:MAG: FecR domain-containing protein, partial [Pirellulales bacterium]|nr:FecR domain-containing protein [Pirellulales bacterium]
MSDSEPAYQVSAELRRLVNLVCDGELTLEEHQRLEGILSYDASARAFYYECLALHGELSWNGAAGRGGTTEEIPASITGPRSPAVNPILNLLDTGFHHVAGLFSRGIVVTVLLTIGLPGILLLLLVLQVSRQPVVPGPIATVTRMHECVWSDNTATASPGTNLFAGEQLRLAKGFVEITYVRGARVLLEGPATFKVSGGGKGFLGNGSLVATAGKGAEGFTIQTPAIAVVDLGTEFGVRVEDERGTAEVEVFQGKVELTTADKEDSGKTFRHPLSAGQAARVEVGDRLDQTPVIREIKPTKSSFARRVPSAPVKPAETVKPEPAIVADFSGGPGESGTDQFPGVAGNGWATGWGVGEAKELECITSIEQSSPLLGGGKYLSVLVERK